MRYNVERNKIKLSEKSYEYYCSHINHDKRPNRESANAKMTRNMLLGLIYKTKGGSTWYAYGSMRFAVRDGIVEWIENGHPVHPKWKKCTRQYGILNFELGIRERKQRV